MYGSTDDPIASRISCRNKSDAYRQKMQTKEITMQDIADQLGTIHYEVACGLGQRIPREYQE